MTDSVDQLSQQTTCLYKLTNKVPFLDNYAESSNSRLTITSPSYISDMISRPNAGVIHHDAVGSLVKTIDEVSARTELLNKDISNLPESQQRKLAEVFLKNVTSSDSPVNLNEITNLLDQGGEVRLYPTEEIKAFHRSLLLQPESGCDYSGNMVPGLDTGLPTAVTANHYRSLEFFVLHSENNFSFLFKKGLVADFVWIEKLITQCTNFEFDDYEGVFPMASDYAEGLGVALDPLKTVNPIVRESSVSTSVSKFGDLF